MLVYFIWIYILSFHVSLPKEDNILQPHLQIHNFTSSKEITLACAVTLPSDIPSPRQIFLETYRNSPIHTRITFHTKHTNDLTCSNSIEVDIILNKINSETIADDVLSEERYTNGLCYVDRDGIPSREISVTINPVTNFDLTWWRCIVEAANGNIYSSPASQGDLLTPYATYQGSVSSKFYKQFNLQLKIDKERKILSREKFYLPLSCTVQNHSAIHTPNLVTYGKQPWKPYIFKMKNFTDIFMIEADMYGRTLENEIVVKRDRISGYEFRDRCAGGSQYEKTCLNEEYHNQIKTGDQKRNLWQDSHQCDNVTLIISHNNITDVQRSSETLYVKSLFDLGGHRQYKKVEIEIKDKVIIEIPSASNYKCFPIFHSDPPYALKMEKGKVFTDHISLCPDFHLYFELYSEVINAMMFYSKMQVKFVTQPPIHGRQQVILSCGNVSSARLVYITSGSCEKNPPAWCGKKRSSGRYSVKTAILENGASKVIEKKPQVNGEQTPLMTCLWEVYFCFSHERLNWQPPSELILVENKTTAESMDHHVEKQAGYNIMPWDCPYGEQYLNTEKDVPVENKKLKINALSLMNHFKKNLYNSVGLYKASDSSRTYLHVQSNVSLNLLGYDCLCQTIPTTCPSDTIKNDLFSTNVLFSQIGSIDHGDPLVWCEAFGQRSVPHQLSHLAIEYLCSKQIDPLDIKTGAHLLPKPYMEIHRHYDYDDNVLVSCEGIPKQCLQVTSPRVTMYFWNNTDINKVLTWTHFQRHTRTCSRQQSKWICNTSTYRGVNNDRSFQTWSNTSISVHRSLLIEYSNMKCTYMEGFRQSDNYDILSKLKTSLETCTDKDFSLSLFKGGKNTVTCEVHYSENGAICSIPNIVFVLKHKDKVLRSLKCLSNNNHRKVGCSYNINGKYVTAVITLSETIFNDSLVTCSYSGVNNTFAKNSTVQDIPTKCIPAPTFFQPSVSVFSQSKSLEIMCNYPRLDDNICQEVSHSNVSIIVERSSALLSKNTLTLAKRTSIEDNIKCSTSYSKKIKCTLENPPNKTLLHVSVPYNFKNLAHIALQPSSKIHVYCSLKINNNTVLSKRTNLVLGFKHFNYLSDSLKDIKVNSTNFKKQKQETNIIHVYNKAHKKIVAVLILIALLIFTFIMVSCIVLFWKKVRSKRQTSSQNNTCNEHIPLNSLPPIFTMPDEDSDDYVLFSEKVKNGEYYKTSNEIYPMKD